MRKVFINSIDKLIVFNESVKSVVIENPIYYRNLAFKTEEELLFSENNIKMDYSKHVLVIYNPLSININDSKYIKPLYKMLLSKNREELIRKIEDLSDSIKNIVNDISYDIAVPLSIADTPDISKLFSAYEVQFQDPTYESFLEMFIKYIKVNCMFNDYRIIVSFGLLDLLTEEEINLLKSELNLLEVYILDFKIQSNNSSVSFIVDEDWCII